MPDGGSRGSRLAWWLVEILAGLLSPAEREAVRGDIDERADTAAAALVDVGGLVLRRQAARWTDGYPWIAVLTIAAPVGLVLSHLSAYWAGGTAIYTWLYWDHWTWGYLATPGARRDLAAVVVGLGLNAVTIAVWAWTGGYALQLWSPGTRGVSVTLLCVITFVGTGELTLQSATASNPAVFASTLCRAVAPCLYRTLLVVLPAWWGARQAQAAWSRPRVLLGAVVVVLLTMRAFTGFSMVPLVTPAVFPVPVSAAWPWRLAGGALLWPMIGVITATAWRGVRQRPTI